jgi:hypothetical protein
MSDESKWLRPVSDGVPTSTLFVGNAGELVDMPPDQILQLCSVVSPNARVDVPDPNKSFLFVTFESADDAEAGMAVLQDAARVGKQLTVKYARRHPSFKVH